MCSEGDIKKSDALLSLKRNNTFSEIVKPLLKGCLTGEAHAFLVYFDRTIGAHLHQSLYNLGSCTLHDLKMANKRVLRLNMLCGVSYTPLSLGMFEILTNKLRSTNNGRPLSIYQEACCGLASGSTAAFVFRPFGLASYRTALDHHNFKNLFVDLHHIVRDEGIFTLWRGSGLHISTIATANVGMLASYNRSLNYLMDTKGLSKRNAVLSASVISGFFAAACSHPCVYVKGIKDVVLKKYHGGEKHACTNIPLYITRILTPHSGLQFYIGFLHHFRRWAWFCMVQWWIYEQIRIEKD